MIVDYPSLLAAVQSYCARTDQTFSNMVPDFVSLAESRMYDGAGAGIQDPTYSPAIRVSEMSTDTTIPFVNSEGTIPSNCLYMRRLSRDNDANGLDYLSPDIFAMREAEPWNWVHPIYYTVEGNTIKLIPGGWAGDLELLYYARPSAITPSNITNGIIQFYGTLYLSATLFEAFQWLRDADAALGWLAKYRSAAHGANKTASGKRHAGGTIRVTPRQPLP